MPKQRYFVTGMQRSGTTVIHNGLRGHPQISAFKQEVAFNRFFQQGASYFCWGRGLADKERRRAPAALFDALAGLSANDQTRAFGINCLMFKPSHAREFVQALNTHFPDSIVVQVQRNDPVAQLGSLIKARKTGVWQRKEENLVAGESDNIKYVEKNKESQKIEIDRYELSEYIISSYKIKKNLRKLNDTHGVHVLNYEKDIRDKDLRNVSSFEPLYDFLGVASVSPKWIQTKKLSPPPEKYISNYQSLSKLAREVRDQLVEGMSPQTVRQRYGPPMTRRVADSVRWHARHPALTARKIWDKCF